METTTTQQLGVELAFAVGIDSGSSIEDDLDADLRGSLVLLPALTRARYGSNHSLLSSGYSPNIKLDDHPERHITLVDDYFGSASPFHTILHTDDAFASNGTYPLPYSWILDVPNRAVKISWIMGKEIEYNQNNGKAISAIMTDDWAPNSYEFYWGPTLGYGSLDLYTDYARQLTNVFHSLGVLHFVNAGFDMEAPSGYGYDDMESILEYLDEYDAFFYTGYIGEQYYEAPDGIIFEHPFDHDKVNTVAKAIETYNWLDYWCHDCGITLVFLQKSSSDAPTAQFCAALAMQLDGPFVGVGCREDWNTIDENDGSGDYWWNWPDDFGYQVERGGPDAYGNCWAYFSNGWEVELDLVNRTDYWYFVPGGP